MPFSESADESAALTASHRFLAVRRNGQPAAIDLWSPSFEATMRGLREQIEICLAAAFSSRDWSSVPMSVSDVCDPHSAKAIIAGLGHQAQVIVASTKTDGNSSEGYDVLGCVLGAILDDVLIDAYRLRNYGASAGDSLLAYIGLTPSAQGSRVCLSGEQLLRPPISGSHGSSSLASLMFCTWMELLPIKRSASIFIRTRRSISPILHLVEKHGFGFCREFDLKFRGETQDRLVFRKRNL